MGQNNGDGHELRQCSQLHSSLQYETDTFLPETSQ